MTLLRSLLYAIAFYLGSIPLVIGAALTIPFGQRAIIASSRIWAWYAHWCARWLLGIRIELQGVLPQRGAIVAIKHEAMFEAMETLCLFDEPAVVFKAELLRIPLWGAVAKNHGVIPVARETGSNALRVMLKAAKEAVAKGRPIVIFPEGTRVAPGEAPPLRAGVAGLYKALGLPIVPVALDSGRLWPKRGLLKRAGVVTMRVGEPIPPGLGRDEVEARVHAGINALNQ